MVGLAYALGAYVSTGVSSGIVFFLIILVVSYGCATTVISFRRVLLALDIGCRSSLRTRGVCEYVRVYVCGVS